MDTPDLFEPEPCGAQPLTRREGLVAQVVSDLKTLREGDCVPSAAFFEERIAAYREALEKL